MTCKICNEKKKIEIKKNNFFLRIDSSDKKLNDYKNYICFNCGTIYHLPKINLKKLIDHYNSSYRQTETIIDLKKKKIDLPLRFDWTGMSFSRFHGFYEIIKNYKKLKFNKNDKILDYGCYQGAFLYACKEILKTKVIGTDYSDQGLKMAKYFFDIETHKTSRKFFNKNIKAKLITLLHVFEHLDDPTKFLKKIKNNLLIKKGYIYLEIPNPFSNPLNDPTHLNLYSEDTIRYILKSTNYELCFFEKRGFYKNVNFMRNNKDLNIHVLARSLNNNKNYFKTINIGKVVESDLLRKRKNITNLFVFKKINFLIQNFLETSYSLFLTLMNLISPNFTITIHEKLKKMIK